MTRGAFQRFRPWLVPLVFAAATPLLAGCLSAEAAGEPFVPADPRAALGSQDVWSPRLAAGLGDPATSGLDDWPATFDVAPKAFDIDGDGIDEIVALASDTNVYVFQAFTGRALAVLPTTQPPGWHVERMLNAVEVGVLRPGEPPSLVVADHAAYVAAWRFVPSASDGESFAFERTFDRRMDECDPSPGMDAKATLADLDLDGTLEVVVQTEEVGFYALRADGSTLWKQCWGGGNAAPVVADLDLDGRPEVVVGSDAGFLSVLAGATGAPLWTFDAAGELGIAPASISVSPTVGDLDGQGPLEVLFTLRQAPTGGPETYAAAHMAVVAVHQDPLTHRAGLLWARQPEWANPLSATQLVVRDVDGDGATDVLGMDWNTVGHYPGDWERLGPAHVFRLDAQGQDVWVRPMDTWWSNKDVAVADLDGAGAFSVVANGPAGPYDGLWRVSAATGRSEAFLPLADWKVARGAQVLDLRHDGGQQLVFPVEPVAADASGRGAILVFELD